MPTVYRHRLGKTGCVVVRAEPVIARTTFRVETAGDGDAFQQSRFAAAILTDQKDDILVEFKFVNRTQ